MGRLKWPGGRSDCTKSIGVTAEDLDSHESARVDFMASGGGQQLRGKWKQKADVQTLSNYVNRFGSHCERCLCVYACVCVCMRVCVCAYFAIDY